MSALEKFLAEGKAYASIARKKEEEGKSQEARKLYIQASEAFYEAAKLTTSNDDKALRMQLAETFYGKACALRPTSTAAKDEKGEEIKAILPVEKPNINFSDVGGLEKVKEEIRKAIVYPYTKPEIYKMYGRKAGEGIMLYGPPGCGKTFIAKATAGECDASFLTLTISEILSKWVGESEKNIRSAFESAEKYAPSILFFDEIDAIGGARGDAKESYAKRLVNELLIQLDGFCGRRENVLVLAGTNEPWAVDPALRRPGRFSKLIFVPPPDYTSRIEIFKIHLRERPIGNDIDFDKLSKVTEGYSSADIAQICIEAADIPLMEALQDKPPRKIKMEDFLVTIENRKSSLTPWFKRAKEEIKRSGEEEIFAELLELVN
ncbi:MAG: ATP-binding protein [Candidatus Thermoplasmatota archaeon]